MRLLGKNRAELERVEFNAGDTLDCFERLARDLRGASELPMSRVKWPAGGSQAFDIPDEEPVKEIVGVIINYHYMNEYYATPYDGGAGGVPDCVSKDGLSGWDADGMENVCARCPKNRMGSGADGRGKACSNRVMLYVLRECEPLPLQLSLPAMTVSNWSAYIMRQLAPRGLNAAQVLTKIALERVTNAKGTPYSRGRFECVGRIDDTVLAQLRATISPALGLPDAELKCDVATEAAKRTISAQADADHMSR